MSLSQIAFRYAKSILDLSKERNSTEKILQDMHQLQAAMKQRDFALFLQSPIIQASKKASVMKAIFADNLDVMTFSFIDILLRKGREQVLPEVVQSFIDQYNTINKISRVNLRSATPLSEQGLESIKAKLLTMLPAGGTLEIESSVDPKLIGGFVVEMDGRILDASVAHQLDQIKKELTQK